MGLPRIGTRGLPGNLEEAKRAGMIPSTWLRNLADRRLDITVYATAAAATADPASSPCASHERLVPSETEDEEEGPLMVLRSPLG